MRHIVQIPPYLHVPHNENWGLGFFCLHNELPNVNRSFPNRQHHIPVYKVNEASCELPRIPAKNMGEGKCGGGKYFPGLYKLVHRQKKRIYQHCPVNNILLCRHKRDLLLFHAVPPPPLFARYPGNVSVCFENPPSPPKQEEEEEEEEEEHAIFCVRRRFTEPPSSLVEIQRFG